MSGVSLHALGDINRLNSAVADLGNAVGALRAIWARSRTKVTAFVYFTYTKQVDASLVPALLEPATTHELLTRP